MTKDELLNATIQNIVSRHPETLEVFIHNGFSVFEREGALAELGAVLRLKTALHTKGIHEEVFTGLLLEKIADTARDRQLLSAAAVDGPGTGFQFVAQLPCALKAPLQRELQVFIEQLQAETHRTLHYYTGSCCNDVLSFKDWLPHYTEVDEIPDLILSNGFHVSHKNFVQRFINKGVYRLAARPAVNRELAAAGLVDEQGCYTTIAANATVMVVDRKRIGDLPVPRTWSDLLKPEYERQVVLNSYGDDFSDIVLLNTYQRFGTKGVAAMGRAVKSGMHPAQMIKNMSSSQADLPPIYIMSHFFAKTIAAPAEAELIWPEDGALLTPLFLLVKADKADEFRELIAFLTGPEIGRICAGAFVPSLHPEVENQLPAGATFQWLGWDFIRRHEDLDGLLQKLNRTFRRNFRSVAPVHTAKQTLVKKAAKTKTCKCGGTSCN